MAEKSRQQLAESTLAELAEKTRQQLAESTLAELAEKSRQQLAESTLAELAESTLAELAESTRQQLAESTLAELAEKTRQQLAESTRAELAESTRQQLAESTRQRWPRSALGPSWPRALGSAGREMHSAALAEDSRPPVRDLSASYKGWPRFLAWGGRVHSAGLAESTCSGLKYRFFSVFPHV
ncbi:unnamed protein product [Linum tenue]|uniref:Uncharacterized protein n=1 Tax=Linum tenue TaxID=586396 RepID=A0AAV0L135_9ROSI|nr:unnamed protein product [Linum tenue]